MKLYYTGATSLDGNQDNPNLSLGNYISSTEVPNDFLGATIADLTNLKLQKTNYKQVFMLALKNTTGATVTDILIHYDYPINNKYKVELGFVEPTNDQFERISSNEALPLSATFAEYSGVANQVNIGDLDNNEYVGIWFKITIVPENNIPLTCDELFDNFENDVVLPTQQDLSFVISYT